MCGRYSLTTPVEALRRLFSFANPPPNLRPRWNIAPTQDAPVVRPAAEGGGRELALLRWGLVPYWAEDANIGSRMINARSESAATRPAFRAAYKARRCLVPADGFYEWPPAPARGPRPPVLFRLKDGGAFAFAGLWERWIPPSGGTLETFTLLTTDAGPGFVQYHPRVPVILSPDDHAAWLDPGADAAARLKSPPAEWFTATPVSTYVNDVHHDDERCFAAAAPGDAAPSAAKPTRSARAKPKDKRQASLF